MQVLKESIRERIDQSAIELFRSHGFEKVSMRKIAAASHMTVGNIYRYYDSKDHLFESLVMPTFNKIKGLVSDEITKEFIDTPERNALFVKRIIDIFLDIHEKDEAVLDILINSCEGSSIDSPAVVISNMLAIRMESLIDRYNKKQKYKIDSNFMASILCESLVDNFIKTLFRFDNNDQRRMHMYHLTQVYTGMFISKIVESE
ncbi:TetR/AcrR family transcriptional regulator [Acidaminobacter sp. JC074]|uniref:TetR/AcrR family transcriptional regulator n=1 Tax=Acidaminobacter sp. JC074 TaxID=2530199 RepID=UPI001F0D9E9B|nr:TetR/AcrR family transcriptional regulator [Acidaminobacter sp. JC074]